MCHGSCVMCKLSGLEETRLAKCNFFPKRYLDVQASGGGADKQTHQYHDSAWPKGRAK